jgi:hypothetical protein
MSREWRTLPRDSPGVSDRGILPNFVETESGVVELRDIPIASRKAVGLKVSQPTCINSAACKPAAAQIITETSLMSV